MKISKGHKVKIVSKDDPFFECKGIVESIHSDGIIVVVFPDNISMMYHPSENALKKC